MAHPVKSSRTIIVAYCRTVNAIAIHYSNHSILL